MSDVSPSADPTLTPPVAPVETNVNILPVPPKATHAVVTSKGEIAFIEPPANAVIAALKSAASSAGAWVKANGVALGSGAIGVLIGALAHAAHLV